MYLRLLIFQDFTLRPRTRTTGVAVIEALTGQVGEQGSILAGYTNNKARMSPARPSLARCRERARHNYKTTYEAVLKPSRLNTHTALAEVRGQES